MIHCSCQSVQFARAFPLWPMVDIIVQQMSWWKALCDGQIETQINGLIQVPRNVDCPECLVILDMLEERGWLEPGAYDPTRGHIGPDGQETGQLRGWPDK